MDEWVFGYIRLVGLECRFAPYLRGVLDKWVFGYTQMPVCLLFKGCFGKEGIWVYPATHSNRLPYTHSGRIRASGYLGIPSYPLKSNSVYPLRSNLREWVFGYTQLPTGSQVEFVRVGIWVYPATHLHRIPYTHSGRICASGYLGIPSYPLDIPRYPLISNSAHPLRSKLREWVFCRICGSGYLGIPSYPLKSNLREWVFGYTQLPT